MISFFFRVVKRKKNDLTKEVFFKETKHGFFIKINIQPVNQKIKVVKIFFAVSCFLGKVSYFLKFFSLNNIFRFFCRFFVFFHLKVFFLFHYFTTNFFLCFIYFLVAPSCLCTMLHFVIFILKMIFYIFFKFFLQLIF